MEIEKVEKEHPENEVLETEVVETELDNSGDDDDLNDSHDDQEETETEETEDVFEFEGVQLDSPASKEEDTEEAPKWVKDLRNKHKEDQKRIKELEARLESKSATPEVPVSLELEPVPDKYDFNTDEEYDAALNNWLVKRDEVNSHKANQAKQQEELKAHYESKFNAYKAEREDIAKRLKGYEEAEQVVSSALPIEKQNLIIAESTKPAMVAYALGKNPDLLKQFAEAKSPVELGRMLGMIESKVNVVKKPKPKSNVTPSVGSAGAPSNRGLESALENARKTGDYTAYRKLKNSVNAK